MGDSIDADSGPLRASYFIDDGIAQICKELNFSTTTRLQDITADFFVMFRSTLKKLLSRLSNIFHIFVIPWSIVRN